jgi:hypothetical protein
MPKKQMKSSKLGWNKKSLAKCTCCGYLAHASTDCYYRMREEKIQWKQIPYHNLPPPDTVILYPELHVKTCYQCDEFGHETMDCQCPEVCSLCINSGYCNHIMDGTHWKDHSHYIIAQEFLLDFDDLTDTNHTHFALIFLTGLMKSKEREGGRVRI